MAVPFVMETGIMTKNHYNLLHSQSGEGQDSLRSGEGEQGLVRRVTLV